MRSLSSLPRTPSLAQALRRAGSWRAGRDGRAAPAAVVRASHQDNFEALSGWRVWGAWRAATRDGKRGLSAASETHTGSDKAAGSDVVEGANKGEPLLAQYKAMLTAQKDAKRESEDYKRRVQRLTFNMRVPHPQYSVKRVSNDRALFEVEATAAGRRATGEGPTKLEAEQNAAMNLLPELKVGRTKMRSMRKEEDASNAHRKPPPVLLPDNPEWFPIAAEVEPAVPIEEPWANPVPNLAHGLTNVLRQDNRVATSTEDASNGVRKVMRYLQRIAQPDEIDWRKIEGFTPPSNDPRLHALATEHGLKFKASTSSITGLLGHIYQIVSNFKPVDTSHLSAAFNGLPTTFGFTLMKKPVDVILRFKDGVYGIDSVSPPGEKPNQILIDLGKSMERMLTMSEGEFRKLLVEPLGGGKIEDTLGELEQASLDGAYNFSSVNGFILRSQLDCIHAGNIFDLKTRATHAIRNCFHVLPDVPVPERHLHFVDYKIKYQKGLWYSFEREVYDMIRSAFLKYSTQLRIGRMHGAFVTYHNTQEIFGFQYVPLSVMDRLVYGSQHIATTHFDQGTKLLREILARAIAEFPPGRNLRLSITPGPSRCRNLRIEVCEVLREEVEAPPANMPNLDPQVTQELSESKFFSVFVRTRLNGREVAKPWKFSADDKFEIDYVWAREEDVIDPEGDKPQRFTGEMEMAWVERRGVAGTLVEETIP